MIILDKTTIDRKIRRIAIQIIENNYSEDEIYLLGINSNGYRLAELLQDEFGAFTNMKSYLHRVSINVAAPLSQKVTVDTDVQVLENKVIILVDDVVNTGRTLFYGFKPLMDILPKKVETAVLINRKHKSYPVNVNYLGLSLATTVQDDIRVVLDPKEEMKSTLI